MVLSSPALAEPAAGHVQEIIVKIQTADGVKWYKLGKELEPINIKEGDYVRFDYADDAIESITVEPAAEAAQEPKKEE
jgi:hypothetical protein